MGNQVRTIQDLYALWYTGGVTPASGALQERFLAKADAPFTTSTAATMINPQYGAVVDTLLNYEADAFQLMRKTVYDSTAFRLETARPATLVSGVGENSALPDTIRGTFTEEEIPPKWEMTRWEITHQMLVRAQLGDGVPQLEAYLRQLNGEYYTKGMNQLMLADAESAASGAGADRTAATDDLDIETLDRIISSDSEEDTFGGTYDHWYDPYLSWDRDAGTTYDSVVLHASGTDRTLDTDLIDDLIRQCKDAGAKKENQYFLTDSQTFMDWSALIDDRYRITEADVDISMNGVRTGKGAEGTVRVATYDGRPVFQSEDVPTDGAGRIFLVDQSGISVKIFMPTQYMRTQMNPHTLLIDAIKDYHAYLWIGETFCTSPARQGKLRDLA